MKTRVRFYVRCNHGLDENEARGSLEQLVDRCVEAIEKEGQTIVDCVIEDGGGALVWAPHLRREGK